MPSFVKLESSLSINCQASYIIFLRLNLKSYSPTIIFKENRIVTGKIANSAEKRLESARAAKSLSQSQSQLPPERSTAGRLGK
jgi:hypothetical protein